MISQLAFQKIFNIQNFLIPSFKKEAKFLRKFDIHRFLKYNLYTFFILKDFFEI